jgi:hypothetical protein
VVAIAAVNSTPTTTAIDREWGQVQRRANADPGVAYVGHRTGQLAARLDPSETGIHRVLVPAVPTPGLGDEPLVYYHPVVHSVTPDGERRQRRRRYRHPFPAHDWLLEAVPDFDLLETDYVNEPAKADLERSDVTRAFD